MSTKLQATAESFRLYAGAKNISLEWCCANHEKTSDRVVASQLFLNLFLSNCHMSEVGKKYLSRVVYEIKDFWEQSHCGVKARPRFGGAGI